VGLCSPLPSSSECTDGREPQSSIDGQIGSTWHAANRRETRPDPRSAQPTAPSALSSGRVRSSASGSQVLRGGWRAERLKALSLRKRDPRSRGPGHDDSRTTSRRSSPSTARSAPSGSRQRLSGGARLVSSPPFLSSEQDEDGEDDEREDVDRKTIAPIGVAAKARPQ
jgi:hypothetical protein